MIIHKKIFLKEIIKFSIGLSLIIFLMTQIELQGVVNSIRNSNYVYVFVGAVVLGFSIFFEGIRLYILINKYEFKFITAMNILFISIFFNNVSSTIIGDGYKIYALKQKIMSWRTPFALVLLERFIGFSAILLIGAICLGFNYSRLLNIFYSAEIEPQVNSTLLLAAGIFSLIAMVVTLKNKLNNAYLGLVKFFKDITNIIRQLFICNFVLIIFLTILSHLFIALKIYVLVQSFNNNVFLTDSVFVIFLLFVTSYIPISIGSLGVREGVTVLSLTFFGIPQSTAAAVAIVARIIIYLYAIIGGILFLFFKKRNTQSNYHRQRRWLEEGP